MAACDVYSGASKVIALDANKESLVRTRYAVERLLRSYPQFSSVEVEYSHFDLKSETPLPKCNFAVLSDVIYYNDLAEVAAERYRVSSDYLFCIVLY